MVQCESGDITEQFRCVRTSADMVNTRAAKFTSGANDPLAGSVGTKQSGTQTRQQSQSQSHHRFVRSGRSRNPTRGSVGLSRGLLASSDRSTSEFVSRPPSSLGLPSCVFLVLLMRRGRVTRRRNMGHPYLEQQAPAPRTVHPSRSAESPSERAVKGAQGLPLPETNSSGGKGISSDGASCLPPAPYSTAGSRR